MSRATSYDVAKLAGVSQSAVSRGFRSGASVSGDTRARVEAAAHELHHASSQSARSLISRHSRMIGAIVTKMSMPEKQKAEETGALRLLPAEFKIRQSTAAPRGLR